MSRNLHKRVGLSPSPFLSLFPSLSRKSKSVFLDNFVKMKADVKSFAWNFFGNLVNKTDGTVKNFNSVYCNNCV